MNDSYDDFNGIANDGKLFYARISCHEANFMIFGVFTNNWKMNDLVNDFEGENWKKIVHVFEWKLAF